MQYYSAITLLACITLAILSVLVHENNRIDPAARRKHYLTYAVIAIANIAEWMGIFLNHAPEWTRLLHAVIKCIDYIVTPMTGAFFIYQVSTDLRLKKSIQIMFAFNAVLQIVSLFTGWTFYLDADNVYHHGPLYFMYMLIYAFALMIACIEFLHYGSNFKKRNFVSLLSIALATAACIFVQEFSGLRITYLWLSIASTLLFIYRNEFSQIQIDDRLSHQQKLLESDALTGLRSRFAFQRALQNYDAESDIPDDFAVLSIDINELKSTNDKLGHLAGDELIKGAAQCISETLGHHGTCFRVGGDEFIVFLQTDRVELSKLKHGLLARVQRWRGALVQSLSVSIGAVFHSDYPDLSVEKLISIADQNMYREKSVFYRQIGKDRRRRP